MSAWWLLPLAVLMVVLHPIPAVPMFDTVYLAEKLQGMTLGEAFAFMAAYHTSPRPVRTLELWLAAKAWGTNAWGYGGVNLLSGCALSCAAACVARRLTGSPGRGVVTGLLTALSYPMIYALLHYPFGVNVSLGLAGFAYTLGRDRVLDRRSLMGFSLIVVAAAGHEVVLALLPVAVMARWWTKEASSRQPQPPVLSGVGVHTATSEPRID